MPIQGALFADEATVLPDLPGADLRWRPHLFGAADAERLFTELHATCTWKQDSVWMYGRWLPVPRLTAWYGDDATTYEYSGIHLDPAAWTAPLLEVKAAVEAEVGVPFNSVLANLYRDGRDSVAWHADDEHELGREPVIASVSFGATRTFGLRSNDDHRLRHDIELTPGSLLVMAGRTQHRWQHRVAKTAKPVGPRINLTFRRTGPRRPRA